MIRIGLVGDYDEHVPAHQAIPIALIMAATVSSAQIALEWIPTEEIQSLDRVNSFHGIWCVPASPYRNTQGALLAIRYAREQRRPFLGTCGGFQHAVVEYARNALGWADAEHAETSPETGRAVISPLECALVEATDTVRLQEGSLIARAYGRAEITEGYRCRYGLNPAFEAQLLNGPLRAVAHDKGGEVRALELDDHPFYVATLFQPERAALKGELPHLTAAFVSACSRQV